MFMSIGELRGGREGVRRGREGREGVGDGGNE